MIERFFPDEEVNKVEEILPERLKNKNLKGLILDVDNTLREWNLDPTESVVKWLEMLRDSGISICLVSNNRRTRIERLSRKLSLHAIHGALKPRKKAFLSALELTGTNPNETAVVGDQIFTDIYGGNRLNMYTIFVRPIALKDNILVRLKRPLERFILTRFRNEAPTYSNKRLRWKQKSGRRKLGA